MAYYIYTQNLLRIFKLGSQLKIRQHCERGVLFFNVFTNYKMLIRFWKMSPFRLPFYDVQSELQKPISLIPQGSNRFQVSQVKS